MLVVAAGLVFRPGRVLVAQRKAGAHLEGVWEFPGGKVDSDEDPRDAVVRELREELGISVTCGEIVDVTFHRYATKAVLLLFYEVTLLPWSPPPQAVDVADFRWAGADDLDTLAFPPADFPVLAKVRTRLRG